MVVRAARVRANRARRDAELAAESSREVAWRLEADIEPMSSAERSVRASSSRARASRRIMT
jgi:hypothetical protein